MTAKSLSTEEFDRIFDEGEEDVLQYCDLDKAVVSDPAFETRRVNVDFPAWVVEALDREARRIGIAARPSSRRGSPSASTRRHPAAAPERLRGLPSKRGKAPQGGGRKGPRSSPAALHCTRAGIRAPALVLLLPAQELGDAVGVFQLGEPRLLARSMTGASFHRASSR